MESKSKGSKSPSKIPIVGHVVVSGSANALPAFVQPLRSRVLSWEREFATDDWVQAIFKGSL